MAPRTQDQPHLIALPDRSDRVDGDAALAIGAGDEGQQDSDTEIETVHDRKADEQHAEQQPPDDPQGRIIEESHGHSPALACRPPPCSDAS